MALKNGSAAAFRADHSRIKRRVRSAPFRFEYDPRFAAMRRRSGLLDARVAPARRGLSLDDFLQLAQCPNGAFMLFPRFLKHLTQPFGIAQLNSASNHKMITKRAKCVCQIEQNLLVYGARAL